jgi:hypothetical protein
LIERILGIFLGVKEMKRMKYGSTLNVRLDSEEAKVESCRVWVSDDEIANVEAKS